ncbi:F-box domain containing protein [Tanacetum coccineum]
MKESHSKNIRMAKMAKAKGNVLNAVIQIISLVNVQKRRESIIKELLLEDVRVIATKMKRRRQMMKNVLWLKHRMRLLLNLVHLGVLRENFEKAMLPHNLLSASKRYTRKKSLTRVCCNGGEWDSPCHRGCSACEKEGGAEIRHHQVQDEYLYKGTAIEEMMCVTDEGDDFNKAKLKEMGHVIEKEILQICLIFDWFDTENSGKMSLADLMHICSLEYQAQIGNTVAMYKIGISYYGLRGLNCDHAKALSWFSKAVDKGEPRSMELLGEIKASGVTIIPNYKKTFEWLNQAPKKLFSGFQSFMRMVKDDFQFTPITSNLQLSCLSPIGTSKVVDIPLVLRDVLPSPFYISKLRSSLVLSGTFSVGDIVLLCGCVLTVDGASVTSFNMLFSLPTNHSVKLIGFTNTDEPIVEVDELGYQLAHTLQVYDPVAKEFRGIGMEADGGSFYIGPYKESLILLNRLNRSLYSLNL